MCDTTDGVGRVRTKIENVMDKSTFGNRVKTEIAIGDDVHTENRMGESPFENIEQMDRSAATFRDNGNAATALEGQQSCENYMKAESITITTSAPEFEKKMAIVRKLCGEIMRSEDEDSNSACPSAVVGRNVVSETSMCHQYQIIEDGGETGHSLSRNTVCRVNMTLNSKSESRVDNSFVGEAKMKTEHERMREFEKVRNYEEEAEMVERSPMRQPSIADSEKTEHFTLTRHPFFERCVKTEESTIQPTTVDNTNMTDRKSEHSIRQPISVDCVKTENSISEPNFVDDVKTEHPTRQPSLVDDVKTEHHSLMCQPMVVDEVKTEQMESEDGTQAEHSAFNTNVKRFKTEQSANNTTFDFDNVKTENLTLDNLMLDCVGAEHLTHTQTLDSVKIEQVCHSSGLNCVKMENSNPHLISDCVKLGDSIPRPISDCVTLEHSTPHLISDCVTLEHSTPRPISDCVTLEHSTPRPISDCVKLEHSTPRPISDCVKLEHSTLERDQMTGHSAEVPTHAKLDKEWLCDPSSSATTTTRQHAHESSASFDMEGSVHLDGMQTFLQQQQQQQQQQQHGVHFQSGSEHDLSRELFPHMEIDVADEDDGCFQEFPSPDEDSGGKKDSALSIPKPTVDESTTSSEEPCTRTTKKISSDAEKKLTQCILGDGNGEDKDKKKSFECLLCGKTYSRNSSLKRHILTHAIAKKPTVESRDISTPRSTTATDSGVASGQESASKNEFAERHRTTTTSMERQQFPGTEYEGRVPQPASLLSNMENSQLELQRLKMHSNENSLSCPVCGEAFQVLSALSTHLNQHTGGGKVFICSTCGKKFATRLDLCKHSRPRLGDKNKRPYQCCLCGEKFYRKSNLEAHCLRNHSSGDPFECETCGKKYYNRRLLAIHKRSHLKEKPFKCTMCPSSFSTGSILKDHMRTHTGELRYMCKICGKRFPVANYLGNHMRTHSDVKPFKCQTCGKAFREQKYLVDHTRTHTGSRPHQCPTCPRAFSALSSLKYHVLTHSKQGKHLCSYCGKSYIRWFQLKQHVNIKHADIKPYKCPNCNKSFGTNYALKRHVSIHVRGKLYRCTDCTESFCLRVDLLRHVKLQHKNKFECSTCGKEFPKHHQLQVHEYVHSENKPFACKEQGCTASFTTGHSLRKHLKKHETEKMYKCSECDEGFPRQVKLDKHYYAVHSKTKRFACTHEACDMSFNKQYHLLRHAKVHAHTCAKCALQFPSQSDLTEHVKTHPRTNGLFMCSTCGKEFKTSSHRSRHSKTHSKSK